MMKYFLILFTFLFCLETKAATCSTTTRTNYSTNQILTSTALNADFNQLVTKANAFDGGCVTDGTLEYTALNSTDFGAVTNGIHQGCSLTYVDANNVGIGNCMLSVDGKFVKTTMQTNVTWGCGGCSAEVTGSVYYIYAKTGSVNTTLNLLLSSTAPDSSGYDVSNNKVLGRFLNNASGDVVQYSLQNWVGSVFSSPKFFSFSVSYGGSSLLNDCTSGTCFLSNQPLLVNSIVRNSTGQYTINLSQTVAYIACTGTVRILASSTAGIINGGGIGTNTSALNFTTTTLDSPFNAANTSSALNCVGNF